MRTDVTSFWSYTQTDYHKPRHFGHLAGLDLADSKFDNNLEVTAYVTSRTDFNGDLETKLETGGGYHRPFKNRRTSFDLLFDESDYWRLTGLGFR